MKLLIDNCVSGKVADALIAAGHDVESVGNWDVDPGDPRVLAFAAEHGRVLVTVDRGFGELALRRRLPTAGIIVIRKIKAALHAEACLRAIAEHGDDLLAGGVVIVAPEKIRARPTRPDA